METIQVGIGIMIVKEKKILLGHRVSHALDTGGIYEPDSWCLPGGKQEFGETIYEAAVREVKEETNLDIVAPSLFGATDDIQPHKHFVTLWMLVTDCQGELRVKEPQKQDCWEWFALDALPQTIYTPSAKFIDAYLAQEA